jgi:hypothetical protein
MAITLVMSLSGCGGLGGYDDDVTSMTPDYHVGSQGVYMRFYEKAPPTVIYDSTTAAEAEIQVIVELHNQGAYDLEGSDGVYMYLGGYDNLIIDLANDYGQAIPLLGRSIYNSEGEIALAEWPSAAGGGSGVINMPESTDRYQPLLQATACYRYVTEASPIVCVSPDPYSITTEQACRPGVVRGNMGSQGAPVAVTHLDAEVIPGEIAFKISISNVGPGRVIDRSAVSGVCPYQLEYTHLNYVDYEITFQGQTATSGGGGACQPDRVRLSNGQGIIFCRFSTDSAQESAYESPVLINLDYGYMDSITTQLDIRRIS